MTALAAARGVRERAIKFINLVLANTVVVQPGSAIFWDPVAQKCTNIVAGGLKFLGFFTGNAASQPTGKFTGDGTTKIQIDLVSEILLSYFTNGTSTHAVASTDFLNPAYALDDTTCSILSADGPLLGTVWDIDTRYGIGILKSANAAGATAQVLAPGVFAAGALAPATVINGAVYDVPTTAAASTITLPAAAPDGTEIEFTADGTKNGNTVQYVDATGPVNITTALTASKRHLVRLVKVNGTWRANAYVSP